ncbi:MAG: hypothetical protein A2177_14265 [Spirochaetes bacterium RBG_13_68_11]|nr:MAG: hypothetical protein A2177_14265 [Spirochaetes bacterium RBG_13_68_11]
MDSKWTSGIRVCGDGKMRITASALAGGLRAAMTSAACGCNGAATLGTRSCSSSSVALNCGLDRKRRCMGRFNSSDASARRLIPWWCAMKLRSGTRAAPRGMRVGVKSMASSSPNEP